MFLALWPLGVERTFPDPRRFPVDAYIFYFVPFWLGVRIDLLTDSGVIDVALTKDIFSSPALIAGFILLLAFGIPVVCAQVVIMHKSGLLRKTLFWVAAVMVPLLIVGGISHDYLSFHFHHWMLGAVGAIFFQGQPRARFSIILNAVLLGVMVNGLIIWGPDPFFDYIEPPEAPPTKLFWTGLNVSGTRVSVEWASARVVFQDWNCSTTLDLQEQEEVVMETSARGGEPPFMINSAQGFLFSQATSVVYRMTVSDVLVFNQPFPLAEQVHQYTKDLAITNAHFQLAVGNDSSESEYLFLDTFTDRFVGGGDADRRCKAVYTLNPQFFS